MRGLKIPYMCAAFLFALIGVANTEEETFFDQFLESPLLVLSTIVIILIGTSVYRKLRK